MQILLYTYFLHLLSRIFEITQSDVSTAAMHHSRFITFALIHPKTQQRRLRQQSSVWGSTPARLCVLFLPNYCFLLILDQHQDCGTISDNYCSVQLYQPHSVNQTPWSGEICFHVYFFVSFCSSFLFYHWSSFDEHTWNETGARFIRSKNANGWLALIEDYVKEVKLISIMKLLNHRNM